MKYLALIPVLVSLATLLNAEGPGKFPSWDGKETIADYARRANALKRFRKEASLLARVRNPYVTNLLEAEELTDVVLVGHSLAGVTITAVADRLPDRLRRLVYLYRYASS